MSTACAQDRLSEKMHDRSAASDAIPDVHGHGEKPRQALPEPDAFRGAAAEVSEAVKTCSGETLPARPYDPVSSREERYGFVEVDGTSFRVEAARREDRFACEAVMESGPLTRAATAASKAAAGFDRTDMRGDPEDTASPMVRVTLRLQAIPDVNDAAGRHTPTGGIWRQRRDLRGRPRHDPAVRPDGLAKGRRAGRAVADAGGNLRIDCFDPWLWDGREVALPAVRPTRLAFRGPRLGMCVAARARRRVTAPSVADAQTHMPARDGRERQARRAPL